MFAFFGFLFVSMLRILNVITTVTERSIYFRSTMVMYLAYFPFIFMLTLSCKVLWNIFF